MHMWMWFGYDLGQFLFPGLDIKTRWSFAFTWIALFFVSLLFEGSKVYLAKVQREALKRIYPHKSDERRTLLCDREQGNMEPTTSRNTNSEQVSRWTSLKIRVLVNAHQTAVFLVHNVVGYLLMLAVMIYNIHLLLAVVFGMMLGYFLFGTKLTRLQMQCFGTKRVVICTPECDDTAETSTPPLLRSTTSSESDFLICQTRTCIQPSHYFPATSQDSSNSEQNACYYGAKKCPSKVARVKKAEAFTTHLSFEESEKGNVAVEDARLLKTECCKKKNEDNCCKREVSVVIHEKTSCCEKDEEEMSLEGYRQEEREQSPQITCCHNMKTSSEGQEEIIK